MAAESRSLKPSPTRTTSEDLRRFDVILEFLRESDRPRRAAMNRVAGAGVETDVAMTVTWQASVPTAEVP